MHLCAWNRSIHFKILWHVFNNILVRELYLIYFITDSELFIFIRCVEGYNGKCRRQRGGERWQLAKGPNERWQYRRWGRRGMVICKRSIFFVANKYNLVIGCWRGSWRYKLDRLAFPNLLTWLRWFYKFTPSTHPSPSPFLTYTLFFAVFTHPATNYDLDFPLFPILPFPPNLIHKKIYVFQSKPKFDIPRHSCLRVC